MVAASEPFASTGFRATHANALPGSVETDARVVNPQKCVRVANRISIVPTMPNVVPIEPADAAKGSNPREPFAWMSTNAPKTPKSAARRPLVLIRKELTIVDARLL